MKLKAFLELVASKEEEIIIYKNEKIIYTGCIDNFLNDKNNKNGIIKEWFMFIHIADNIIIGEYPVLQILLKGDNEK